MPEGWTQDRVLSVASDPASAKAGQGLANAKKWVSLGKDSRVVWGECQGSGAEPYQVRFDLTDASSKCSCPSRKFPCKHAIGLMLMHASSGIADQTLPAWVEEWMAGRAERAKKKEERAQAPPAPVDKVEQAKRQEKRYARIGEGLSSLKTWAEDLIRSGIATLPSKGYALFDEPARRMIDAQAPGIARRVQILGEIVAAGQNAWQRSFTEQLASIYLAICAFEKLDSLPESTQSDLLAMIGVPPKPTEGADAIKLRDHWQIIAQEIEAEDRLRVQRTWLYGRESKRSALVLAFAHGSGPLDSSLSPGMSFDGEVSFFPGNGLRAAVGVRNDLQPLKNLASLPTLDALCNAAGELFAAHPWAGELAAPVQQIYREN